MSYDDSLKSTFRTPEKVSRREARAARTRSVALSPLRNVIRILMAPVVTLSLTVTIYVQTSPYERQDALIHLAALTGCDAALAFGVAGAEQGDIGYHPINDPDGDGVACPLPAENASLAATNSGETVVQTQRSSDAKFITAPTREN